jgi:hypothetical protein
MYTSSSWIYPHFFFGNSPQRVTENETANCYNMFLWCFCLFALLSSLLDKRRPRREQETGKEAQEKKN